MNYTLLILLMLDINKWLWAAMKLFYCVMKDSLEEFLGSSSTYV